MITPPPSSLSRYLIQERKVNLLIKARSREKNLFKKLKNDNSDSPFTSRSFIRKNEKPTKFKFILAPKSRRQIEAKVNSESFFVPRLSSESNFTKNKTPLRPTTHGFKEVKKKTSNANFIGLQGLLNELLVDKKHKCLICSKCICECDELSKNPQKKPYLRKKTEKNVSMRNVVNETHIENNELKIEENDFCIINQRKVPFSSFHNKSFLKIHSQLSQGSKHHAKIRSNKNKIPNNLNSEIDLVISVSPICFSHRIN